MPRASQTSSPPVGQHRQQTARIFAGTSGWAYPTWKPDFYSASTPAKKFLEFYSSRLSSVEVNYTFRALPTAKVLEGWLGATPEHFRFTFKAPQRITHFKRLRECAGDIAQFIAAVEPVRQEGKLGLLLFQLPPNFKADVGLLDQFLRMPVLQAEGAPPLTFEFRHESWFCEEIYEMLRRHGASLCVAEGDDLVTPEVCTSSTQISFRFRRSGGYSPAELKALAQRLSALAQQRDVYAYFKHEDEPMGALNAVQLLARTREAGSR